MVITICLFYFQITVATYVKDRIPMTALTIWHPALLLRIHLFLPTWHVRDRAYPSRHWVRGRETRWTGHESQGSIPRNAVTLTFMATGILIVGPTYMQVTEKTHAQRTCRTFPLWGNITNRWVTLLHCTDCEAQRIWTVNCLYLTRRIGLLSRSGLMAFIKFLSTAFTAGFKLWFTNN